MRKFSQDDDNDVDYHRYSESGGDFGTWWVVDIMCQEHGRTETSSFGTWPTSSWWSLDEEMAEGTTPVRKSPRVEERRAAVSWLSSFQPTIIPNQLDRLTSGVAYSVAPNLLPCVCIGLLHPSSLSTINAHQSLPVIAIKCLSQSTVGLFSPAWQVCYACAQPKANVTHVNPRDRWRDSCREVTTDQWPTTLHIICTRSPFRILRF